MLINGYGINVFSFYKWTEFPVIEESFIQYESINHISSIFILINSDIEMYIIWITMNYQ